MTALPDECRGPAEPTTQSVEGFFENFFVCVCQNPRRFIWRVTRGELSRLESRLPMFSVALWRSFDSSRYRNINKRLLLRTEECWYLSSFAVRDTQQSATDLAVFFFCDVVQCDIWPAFSIKSVTWRCVLPELRITCLVGERLQSECL